MRLSHPHIAFWLALPLIVLVGGRDLSSQTVLFPDPESKLWIEGQSNINRFSCNAEQYDGRAEIRNEQGDPNPLELPDNQISLGIQIPVASFECGRSRMNQDLIEALKSESYPFITFVFSEAETQSGSSDESDDHILKVTGILTVAGVSREISFLTTGSYLPDGRVRANGRKTILMTDYNIEPPTGLFGLIKAEDELSVHFDLYSTLPEMGQKREARER